MKARKILFYVTCCASIFWNASAHANISYVTCSIPKGFLEFKSDNSGGLHLSSLKICDLSRGGCGFDLVYAETTFNKKFVFSVYKAKLKPKDNDANARYRPMEEYDTSPGDLLVTITRERSTAGLGGWIAKVSIQPDFQMQDSVCEFFGVD